MGEGKGEILHKDESEEADVLGSAAAEDLNAKLTWRTL